MKRLRFKREGLENLRRNPHVRLAVKEMHEKGRRDALLLYVCLVACADENGGVTCNDEELREFLNFHIEEIGRMADEVLGL
jgi:hypothetical protein